MSIVLCNFCDAEIKFYVVKKITIQVPAANKVSIYESCNQAGQTALEPLGAECIDTQYQVHGKCTKCGMSIPKYLEAYWDSTRKIIIIVGGLENSLLREATKEEHTMIGERIHNRSKSKQLSDSRIGFKPTSPKAKVAYKGILKAASTKKATEQHYD